MNLESTLRVFIRGVGLKDTYPHSRFRVEAEMISPKSLSMTMDKASKLAEVLRGLP